MKNKIFYVLLGYQIITFIFFLYGPISYNNNIPYNDELYFLFVLYMSSIILGYLFSGFFFSSQNYHLKFKRSKNNLVLYGVLIGFIFVFIEINNVLVHAGWSVFLNPGEAYALNLQREKKSGLITQLSTLTSVFIYFSCCCGFLYFKELKRMTKIILILFVMSYIFSFLLKGVNFGIFFMLLSFAVIYYVREGGRKIFFVFIIFISIFFYAISSRMQLQGIPNSIFGLHVDEENFLIKMLPEFLAAPLVVALPYMSQGYYALYLATEMAHEWTYGLGGGWFIMNNFRKFFDINVWERTYQFRMESIWDPEINWHTAYVWIANDWGLYGVFFPLFILGAFFNLIVRDAEKGNIFALALMPIYVMIFLFLPANNILFGNPSVFMPFFWIMIVWFLSRKWKLRSK